MPLPQIDISGRGMKLEDSICDYITEKIKKHEGVFQFATKIEVVVTSQVPNRGAKTDYRVEVLMRLPKADARVEKEGHDIKALVDEISDVLYRKVNRYREQLNKWEGKEDWSDPSAVQDEEDAEVIVDQYAHGYVPRIVRRKKIENCTPVSETEALERMEMLGYDCFLFKNIATGKFSMVYRRKAGGYGLVEPCDEN